ncbi:MAG: signal peptidase I, partial [Pseudomonadota bacterium]|nr:signal peptidase I [Pseudomonadota bacterium]
MNIDLPLILTVIVGASGAIWLIDSLLFASARSARLTELQTQYPRWNVSESADANFFIESASREATDPVVVEYAKS